MKTLKKELLIYLVILISLSLYMHPERITMIDSPLKLLHAFAWSFGVYLIIAVIRAIFSLVFKLLRKINKK